MATKSKFFRVAVEGSTATDGRTIERSWLTDIAAGYNRATYGARINLEHIRGYSPNSDFKAYGDVLSVKTENVTISLNNKDETRLALFAEIEPTDDLVAMTKKKQKIYTSIEVAPNFAGTDKAGLVGLAVTDSPASLGTEVLVFSATQDNAAAAQLRDAFDSRKQDKANVFSAAQETAIEFIDDTPAEGALEKFAKLVVTALSGQAAPAKEEPKPAKVEASSGGDGVTAEQINTLFSGLAEAMTADRKADREATDARFNALATTVETLKSDLEATPSTKQLSRLPSSGGSARIQADC